MITMAAGTLNASSTLIERKRAISWRSLEGWSITNNPVGIWSNSWVMDMRWTGSWIWGDQ